MHNESMLFRRCWQENQTAPNEGRNLPTKLISWQEQKLSD